MVVDELWIGLILVGWEDQRAETHRQPPHHTLHAQLAITTELQVSQDAIRPSLC